MFGQINQDALNDVSAVTAFAHSVNHNFREDQTIFAANALNYVKARTYDRQLPAMNGLAFIPQESDAPEWAESITYRSFDEVGMAKIIANYADDLPRADVKGTERMVPVRTIGDSYGYNINELNASVALGTQLPERKATAARRAIEVKLNQIAMVGDPQYGLFGITNHPNIGATTGLTGDWAAVGTTGAQIVADFNIMVDAVRVQSKGVHEPTLAMLPLNAVSAMNRKYVADSGNKTAAQVVRELYPNIRIAGLPELENVGGDSIALIGEFSVENMALETVMPFNQLPAQARNLELVVPCMARTGGVSVHYPLAFTRVVGL